MTLLLFALLGVCLFWGAKISKRKEWNEDVLSFAQTKSFLGFCALIIILHHCSQRTCAPWLPEFRIVHGLDDFVFWGYLCVAVFFFCSGYGMYTSFHKKEGFFKGYYKRILKILIPTIVVWITFFMVEKGKGMRIPKPVWYNTFDYIWYIPAMIYMYLIFYFSFRFIKKETLSVVAVFIGTCIYFVLCMFFSPGTWWYNTPHLFIVGIITARHKEKIGSFFKKGYPFWIALSLIITFVGFAISNYYYPFAVIFGWGMDDKSHFIAELTGQVISALTFVIFVMLIGLKIKIGNKVLAFLGGFTLELYLVHPLFVQLFSYAFMQDSVKPLYHIKNPFLYSAAVAVVAIPLAFGLHKLVTLITGSKKNS